MDGKSMETKTTIGIVATALLFDGLQALLTLSWFGVILNPEGGVLEKLLLPFKLGAGGKVGSGDQWVTWIARTDLVRAIGEARPGQAVKLKVWRQGAQRELSRLPPPRE